jgi:hypothetical protein
VRFKNKREETGAKFETLKQSLLLVMSEEELHAMLLSAAGGPESSSDVRAVCGFSFVSHPSNMPLTALGLFTTFIDKRD